MSISGSYTPFVGLKSPTLIFRHPGVRSDSCSVFDTLFGLDISQFGKHYTSANLSNISIEFCLLSHTQDELYGTLVPKIEV